MGSQQGAERAAAARAGVSLAEWDRRRRGGQRWCCKCQKWLAEVRFGSDRSRPDGRSVRCKSCNRNLTIDRRSRHVKHSEEQPPKGPSGSDAPPALSLTTGDPRFDPQRPLTVNGYRFAPVTMPDHEAAWREFHEKLSWMQNNDRLHIRYLGWHMADIANDLIARAYEGLAPTIPKP